MAHQKSNMEFWFDEAGTRIPYNRTTTLERRMETKSGKLLREAKKLNKALTEYKELIRKESIELFEAFMEEKEVKGERKGNFTWFNFDRSVKIEVNVSERITFDDLTITAAREKLDSFIEANVNGKVDFVKEMVNDAFKTSRGQLDSKKVMSLMKYRTKIKDELFQTALNLIEQAIRRPDSKIYYRISELDAEGKYQAIELNMSNI